MDEKKINFVQLHEYLSSRRLVKNFLDWCATIHKVEFSEPMLLRVARQKGEETEDLTARQRLLLEKGNEFMQSQVLQTA